MTLVSLVSLVVASAQETGEAAMQELEAAQVPLTPLQVQVQLEEHLDSMVGQIDHQLEEAKDTRMNYRRKREAFSEEEVEEGDQEVENPLAKFTMPEVVSVFKSVKVLREAYNNLMESYSNYKNQKALETDEEEDEDAENDENDDESDVELEQQIEHESHEDGNHIKENSGETDVASEQSFPEYDIATKEDKKHHKHPHHKHHTKHHEEHAGDERGRH